jgi:hypothetical protein
MSNEENVGETDATVSNKENVSETDVAMTVAVAVAGFKSLGDDCEFSSKFYAVLTLIIHITFLVK